MFSTTSAPYCSRRSDRPFNPGRRHRADFARQATIDAFGWHFARALDQSTFVDRLPGEMLKPSPEARFR